MITSVDTGFSLAEAPPEPAEALAAQAARCLGAVRAAPAAREEAALRAGR
ncbi:MULTISPECIES: hypothetical protein [Streptomyces]|nr:MULTISPECIES: hypothetical protein [Streptomyces]